jgi:hypothetical protein
MSFPSFTRCEPVPDRLVRMINMMKVDVTVFPIRVWLGQVGAAGFPRLISMKNVF